MCEKGENAEMIKMKDDVSEEKIQVQGAEEKVKPTEDEKPNSPIRKRSKSPKSSSTESSSSSSAKSSSDSDSDSNSDSTLEKRRKNRSVTKSRSSQGSSNPGTNRSTARSRSPHRIYKNYSDSDSPLEKRAKNRSVTKSRSSKGSSIPGKNRSVNKSRSSQGSSNPGKNSKSSSTRSRSFYRIGNIYSDSDSDSSVEKRKKYRSVIKSRISQGSSNPGKNSQSHHRIDNIYSDSDSDSSVENRRKSRSGIKSSSFQRNSNPGKNSQSLHRIDNIYSDSDSDSSVEKRRKSRLVTRSRSFQRSANPGKNRSVTKSRSFHRSSNPGKKFQSFSDSDSSVEKRRNYRSVTRSRSFQRSFNSGRNRSRSFQRTSNPWKKNRSPTRSRSPRTSRSRLDDNDDDYYYETEFYRRRHQISVASCDHRSAPKPIQSFRRSGFGQSITRRLELRGYASPTPIQAQSWPVALAGTNLMMVSGSGTGKTLGCLLPGIRKIQAEHHHHHQSTSSRRRNDGPIVLVLVDCREAALLVQKEAVAYTNPRELRSQCIMGSGRRSIANNSSPDLLVATAGRFLELMPTISLDRCTYLVIDDIDRLLDVGFKGQLCRLLSLMHRQAQLVISATSWTRDLQRLARKYMGNYTLVRVGGEIDASEGLLKIRQRVMVTSGRSKMEQLKKQLAEIYDSSDNPGKVVIYSERQRQVDELVAFVRLYVPCAGLHGGRSASERDDIIRAFRHGSYNIIVATDMTQRGLDVPGIRYVINYDFPYNMEGYVQRLTRTGICQSESRNCEAISFITQENLKVSRALVDFLEEYNQPVDPQLRQMAKNTRDSRSQRRKNHWARRNHF
ncbi:putative ATP-dependent RNA helicase CG14443 [Drosophila takahashii]|uniref:putative ATP-dependent RNA helicase CG14443 n=1 Tax=Drosophila takahashii TaxID=29030 RepID=UPI001CF848D1|nr:putative ATP-dependent RNA helicase CG14443 [Drosophila takahashii]